MSMLCRALRSVVGLVAILDDKPGLQPGNLTGQSCEFHAPQDLLEVFVRRHETASTLITTNRPTQDWGVFLGDVPAATAILDRFLAHATIVQVVGKSYRLRQRTGTADD